MELFNPNSKIDFMGARRWAALLSALIFIVSIGGLLINGLHWGLDFTGGTQIEISYQKAADLNQIRESLAKAGFSDPQVVSYGTSRDVLISIRDQIKRFRQKKFMLILIHPQLEKILKLTFPL